MNKVRTGKSAAATLLLAAFTISIFLLPGKSWALNAAELINYFVDELTPYGRWEEQEPYGRVWSPSQQSAGWRPYSQGHWVNSEEYGWVWKPEEKWGEIPYHYGRWAKAQNHWFWVPDDTWGPAWVDWREDDDYIGWSPLPPEAEWNGRDEWRPSYRRPDYEQDSYVFVPRRYFSAPRIHSYIIPYSQMNDVIKRSRNITVYRSLNQRVVNEGPRRELIEHATNQKLRPIHYEPRPIHGREPASYHRNEGNQARQQADEMRSQEHIRANSQEREIIAHQRESQAVHNQNFRADEPYQRGRFDNAQHNVQEPKHHEEASQQVNHGRKEAQERQVFSNAPESRAKLSHIQSNQHNEQPGGHTGGNNSGQSDKHNEQPDKQKGGDNSGHHK